MLSRGREKLCSTPKLDITSALRLSLVGGSRDSIDANSTDSIEAYELFLEARQLIQGRSVAGLERALKINPELASRHAVWCSRCSARSRM